MTKMDQSAYKIGTTLSLLQLKSTNTSINQTSMVKSPDQDERTMGDLRYKIKDA